jgi:hypothetical protein
MNYLGPKPLAKELLVIILLSLSSVGAYSGENSKKAMRGILDDYLKLVPFMYSEKAEMESDSFKKYLIQLEDSFQKTEHLSRVNQVNFRPALTVMQESLSDIRKSLKGSDYSYLRYRTRELMTVCISCHAQLPSQDFPKIYTKHENTIEKYIKTNKERAMVAYFLRDYDSALLYFKREVSSNIRAKKADALEKSLVAVLKLYLINLESETLAKRYFTELSSGQLLPEYSKKLVLGWVKELNSDFFSHYKKEVTEKELSKIIKTKLIPIEDEIKNFSFFHSAALVYRIRAILSVSSSLKFLKVKGICRHHSSSRLNMAQL